MMEGLSEKENFKVTFDLNKPSPLEASTEISGLLVEVKVDSNQVVVYDYDAADVDEARMKALTAANQFLNTLSWKHHTDLEIRTGGYSVEHTESSGKKHVNLVIPTAEVGLRSCLVAVHKDASGNIISVSDSRKLGRINVKPSDAAAYYRRAHLTDDPFDRFLNLYLVTENVSDRIREKKGWNKKELQDHYEERSSEMSFLRLGLDECFADNLNLLKEATKRFNTFDNAQSIITQVAERLYRGCRVQVTHSKDSEAKKIPFNPQDEEEVKTILPLMDFVAKSLLEYEASQ